MTNHFETIKESPIKTSSNRSFGLTFAFIFTLLSGWSFWEEWRIEVGSVGIFSLWIFIGILATGFLGIGLLRPAWLAVPNRFWTQFGLFLGKIIQPIVMGCVFFLIVTPMGLLMRLTGYDPMRRKFDPTAHSYWIKRDPPGPKPGSLTHQF